jgi:hypothetical protein
VLHGHVVARDGQVIGEPHGRILTFHDTLPGGKPVA